MRRVFIVVLGLFLVSCGGDGDGGDRKLPDSAGGKVRAMTDALESVIDSVCACPNINISRAECEKQIKRMIPDNALEALECMADVLDRNPGHAALVSEFFDCPVNVILDVSDCMIAADCQPKVIEDCQKDIDRIDSCPEPKEVPADLEIKLNACFSELP